MQGKNPPAEPGPAGGLRFRARQTLEISGRSRDLLYLCVITRSARRHPPAGARGATAGPGGFAPRCPPFPGCWETPRLLIHAGGSCPGGSRRFLRLYPPPSRGWETHGREGRGGPGETRGEQSSREGMRGEGGRMARRGVSPVFFPGKGVFRATTRPPGCLWLCRGFLEVSGEKTASHCIPPSRGKRRSRLSPGQGLREGGRSLLRRLSRGVLGGKSLSTHVGKAVGRSRGAGGFVREPGAASGRG